MTLTLSKGQIAPILKSSKEYMLFDCSCGCKSVSKRWRNFANGITKTCGNRNLLSKEYFAKTKFGKLRMKNPEAYCKGSTKKVEWICDCGKETISKIYSVTSEHTRSCRNCNLLSKEYFEKTKFGKLRMKNPEAYHKNSTKKVEWVCDCGKETIVQIYNVTSEHTRSCGNCNFLSKKYFEKTKFGKLRMKNPEAYTKGSGKKVEWVCDCGKEKLISIHNVTNGNTVSCGNCNLLSKEYFTETKFGKLRMKNPEAYHKNSDKKTEWICDCGKEKLVRISSITRGESRTCGTCRKQYEDWYSENEDYLRKLKCPISPGSIPSGSIQVLETITNTRKPFKAICQSCDNTYYPCWDSIRRGTSLTCGCYHSRITKGQLKLKSIMESFGLKVELEHLVNGLKYD
ncbi:MAG TPA: hypothetical protein ENI61_03490, partial [Ignavibacteria bacterium]|nr:hypothetical protein [Ignavibacteria bacterium]